jgi:hypothetical protein
MLISRTSVGAAICAGLLLTAPGMAQTHHITTLGRAPLLGTSTTRAQMSQLAHANSERLALAGQKLGMTPAEFRSFKAGLSTAKYVVVPRHLDGMSWYDGGTYVTADVMIPSDTRGWEVDVVRNEHLLRVFMPATCGNLSILRSMQPRLAAKPAKASVESSIERMAMAPTPAPAATEAPAPTPAPVAQVAEIHPAPAAVHHARFGWLPYLLVGAVIPLLFHGGSQSQPAPTGPIPVAVVATPIPIVTPCPPAH